MEIEVDVRELTKVVQFAAAIAERKGNTPLAHVLFIAQRDQLKLIATDSEIFLTQWISASVIKPGSLAVHAKHFADFVKTLSSGAIHLKSEKNRVLVLDFRQIKASFLSLSEHEFPVPMQHMASQALIIEAGMLIRAIERTLSATSSSETRQHLNGIYCELPQDDILRFVSMDGHRLALTECPITGKWDRAGNSGVMLPKKAMHELRRILLDKDEKSKVTLSLGQGTIIFHIPGTTLDVRLLAVDYPDYRKLIPQESEIQCVVPTSPLATALKRIALFSEKNHAHAVRFSFSQNKLMVSASDPESGDGQESLTLDYQGKSFSTGFNAQYVLDALGLMYAPMVRWRFTGELSPVLLEPIVLMPEGVTTLQTQHQTRLAAAGFLAVVMPLRL